MIQQRFVRKYIRSVSVSIFGTTVLSVMLTVPRPLHAQQLVSESGRLASASMPRSVAQSTNPGRAITVRFENTPLRMAVQEIVDRSGLAVTYSPDILPAQHRVTYTANNVAADEALLSVLKHTPVRLERLRDGGVRLVRDRSAAANGSAIVATISGQITDAATKQPIAGASVSIGTTRGVQTKDDGTYRIPDVPAGTHTITVRRVGYVKATRSVTVTDDATVVVNVALTPSVNALDQVIVTGTVVATAQREIPNAMTVITAKDIEQQGITRIDQLFHGDIPGLFAQNQGSFSPTDQIAMFSRGSSSLNTVGNQTMIKVYVDGVELADPTYASQIDPKSIERIEVVSGPQASTIYGSNAINGVMQIFTKRGSTARPQLTATLLSGWVQNNFRSTLTPQHDYAAQVTGTEGRWSYQAGAAWNYIGPWSPSKQTARTNGFGGARTQLGPVSADLSLRLSLTENKARAAAAQYVASRQESGEYSPASNAGFIDKSPTTTSVKGQTFGVTLGYTPLPWWSHEMVLGNDVTDVETLVTEPSYLPYLGFVGLFANDTLVSVTQTHRTRLSTRYATTANVAIGPAAQLVVTAGADQWQSIYTYVNVRALTLTGTLNGTTAVQRQPSHNAGAFVQGRLGLWDALYLTYGLRAEWNPNYGDSAQPNLSPRYGIAYTREFGPVTAKLRASYGRATRPPTERQKSEQITENTTYGRYLSYLASSELGPEYQQGGEGGLEFYLGSRGSLVITRYNQTVDGLIYAPKVDSAQSLLTNSSGVYTYTPIYQYLNVGSIRNQGWELQGSVTTGPFTTRGTYSWTKSRTIGITQKYRDILTGAQFRRGASFNFLPEHTWAANVTYAHALTTVTFNLRGTGLLYRTFDAFSYAVGSNVRLTSDKPRIGTPTGYQSLGAAYALADLSASHRFTPAIEGVLQVQNVGNYYQNDYAILFAAMGRQTRAGLRVRL